MAKQQQNEYFKPDPTITVVKGFPHKGPCLISPNEDLTMDMNYGRKKHECSR